MEAEQKHSEPMLAQAKATLNEWLVADCKRNRDTYCDRGADAIIRVQ